MLKHCLRRVIEAVYASPPTMEALVKVGYVVGKWHWDRFFSKYISFHISNIRPTLHAH